MQSPLLKDISVKMNLPIFSQLITIQSFFITQIFGLFYLSNFNLNKYCSQPHL